MFSLLLPVLHVLSLSVAHFGDWSDYVDLSYTFSDATIFFPGQTPFSLTKTFEWPRANATSTSRPGESQAREYYQAFSFCMGEHGGTHLDAPYHFWESGWTVTDIAPNRLLDVPGAVIDITSTVEKAESPEKYELTVANVMQHESKHGEIPKGCVVLVRTGWSRYWGDKNNYLGMGVGANDTRTLAFPGISLAAAQFLYYERSVVGVGIDSASVDPGSSASFPVHRFLASKNVYNLENVANLHLLDRRLNASHANEAKCSSFKLLVLPLPIVGGTGAPTRILARCVDVGEYQHKATAAATAPWPYLAVAMSIAVLIRIKFESAKSI